MGKATKASAADRRGTVGGYLSQPAKKYPSIFSTQDEGLLALGGLWERYPYFLPCIVSSLMTWCSLILGAFLLQETLPSKVAERERGRSAAGKATEQTPLLRDSALRPSENQGATSVGESAGSSQHRTLPTSPASNRPSFARPRRKRSRMGLGQVQSWTSGFTPIQSRDASPVRGAPQPDKDEGVMGLLRVAHVRQIMLSYAFLSLTSVALDAVQVLYFVGRWRTQDGRMGY